MDTAPEKPFDIERFENELKDLLNKKSACLRVQNSSIHNSATSEEKAAAREKEAQLYRQIVEFVAQNMSQVNGGGRKTIINLVESAFSGNHAGSTTGILLTFWKDVLIHTLNTPTSPESKTDDEEERIARASRGRLFT